MGNAFKKGGLFSNIEQGVSGGKGWGGAIENVGKVGSALANPVGFAINEVAQNSLGKNNPLKMIGDITSGAGNLITNGVGGLAKTAGDIANGAVQTATGDAFKKGGIISNIEQGITHPQAQDNSIPNATPNSDPFAKGGAISNIEQSLTGGKGVGGVVQGVGNVLGDPNVQKLAGNYLGQGDVAKHQSQLQSRAYQEMMGRSKEGENQFLGSLNEANPALASYAKDIQDMGTQNIGRQQNIINQQLSRAGVKGGQAANLYGRQIGELQNNGMRDINKLAYEDAQNRANQKSQYFANKGQSGFNLVPKYS